MKNPLIDRLESAYQVCHECGSLYGDPRSGYSTMWEGPCDVCGENKAVTEVRDYRYLSRGIAAEKLKLTQEEVQEEGGAETATLEVNEGEAGVLYNIMKDLAFVADQVIQDDASENFYSLKDKVDRMFEHNFARYSLAPSAKAFSEAFPEQWVDEIGNDGPLWRGFKTAWELGTTRQTAV